MFEDLNDSIAPSKSHIFAIFVFDLLRREELWATFLYVSCWV